MIFPVTVANVAMQTSPLLIKLMSFGEIGSWQMGWELECSIARSDSVK